MRTTEKKASVKIGIPFKKKRHNRPNNKTFFCLLVLCDGLGYHHAQYSWERLCTTMIMTVIKQLLKMNELTIGAIK